MFLKEKIQNDMKLAMKSQDKDKLSVIRMILSGIKQKEIDDRIVLDDTQIVSLLRKMQKQRMESERIYIQANREDLALKEKFEIGIIDEYLPVQLSEEDIKIKINNIISKFGDVSIKDMGKIMAQAKVELSNIADMGFVSSLVKNYFQNKNDSL